MQSLADWLTASRARVYLGAVVLSFLAVTPLFVTWLPGALLVLLALRQSENNQARAAQRLGIPRTTLRDKMAKYGIPGG